MRFLRLNHYWQVEIVALLFNVSIALFVAVAHLFSGASTSPWWVAAWLAATLVYAAAFWRQSVLARCLGALLFLFVDIAVLYSVATSTLPWSGHWLLWLLLSSLAGFNVYAVFRLLPDAINALWARRLTRP